MRTYKGFFRPRNPAKYKGDPGNIVYRSRWELVVMKYLDEHPDILQWSSEEIVIPYRSPIDGRVHRYFPDFYVKKKNVDGKIETCLIEVKPDSQTRPPERPKTSKAAKPTARFLNEVRTWGINDAKWKAAREYCADRKWNFYIFTEKTLNLTF